jgi:hypothetical protein
MDVIEEAERRVRKELLAVVDLPGLTSRARLYAILKKAFELFESVPLLNFLTGWDYDTLFRRVPPEKFQEHMHSDQNFFADIFSRCQANGINIRIQPDQLMGLLYPLAVTLIHKEDIGKEALTANMDLMLELIAAYCLGEVESHLQIENGLTVNP